MSPPTALIVGTGISGITIAHRLQERGWRVTLIEASDRIGGAIRSKRIDGYLCEDGPNSMLIRSQVVREFLRRQGLDDRMVPASTEANKRFIVRGGKPLAVPQSVPGAITTPLFSFGAKLRLLKEPWIRAHELPDESVADFVRRRLGPEFLEYAIGPMTSGIYAGDPEKLSIRYAFHRVWNLENKAGSLIRGALLLRREQRRSGQPRFKSGLYSFREGLSEVIERLSEPLSNRIFLKAAFNGLRRTTQNGWTAMWSQAGRPQQEDFDRIIITAPPHQWAEWDLPTPLAGRLLALPRLSFPAVNTLVLGFRKEDVTHPLDGFGMLIPRSERQPMLGTIFSSSLFPDRAPDGHVSLMNFIGGMTHPEAAAWDENEAVTRVNIALRALLGITGEPTFRRFTAWPKAIPQYHLDYGDFDSGLHRIEETCSGLHFQGNFRGGPGLNDCVENGLQLAERIAGASEI